MDGYDEETSIVSGFVDDVDEDELNWWMNLAREMWHEKVFD